MTAAFEPTPAELAERRTWAAERADVGELYAGATGAFQAAVKLHVIALRHGNAAGAAEHLRTMLAISHAVDEITHPTVVAA